jgi:hypothetical protein
MSYIDPCPPACPEPAPPFHLAAVVVCDQYSDFLRITLPANKHIFDRIVVVTSYEDKATQRICEYNHVEVVRTDKTESRKGHFCKGAAINDGLRHVYGQMEVNWMVHLDGDIVLPPQTRILLERMRLNQEMIYGIDRFNVKGCEAWDRFNEVPRLQHECDAYIHLDAFPMGTRIMSASAGGYIPIGFFQMWSPAISGIDLYPEGHTDAGREDMLFAKLWPRSRRHLLPEIVGYHLESEDASMSSNWKGRKTAPFTR